MDNTMIIRPGTLKDIDALMPLAFAMHAESPRFSRYTFLPERARQSLEMVLNMKERGFMLVAEQDGMLIGGMVAFSMPHFACDVVQAGDLSIFIDEQHRGGSLAARLIKAYLKWAESIGAEPSIGINTGVHPERTAQLLQALGAAQTGTTYTWGIQ